MAIASLSACYREVQPLASSDIRCSRRLRGNWSIWRADPDVVVLLHILVRGTGRSGRVGVEFPIRVLSSALVLYRKVVTGRLRLGIIARWI
jgi:hypothetical protein